MKIIEVVGTNGTIRQIEEFIRSRKLISRNLVQMQITLELFLVRYISIEEEVVYIDAN